MEYIPLDINLRDAFFTDLAIIGQLFAYAIEDIDDEAPGKLEELLERCQPVVTRLAEGPQNIGYNQVTDKALTCLFN